MTNRKTYTESDIPTFKSTGSVSYQILVNNIPVGYIRSNRGMFRIQSSLSGYPTAFAEELVDLYDTDAPDFHVLKAKIMVAFKPKSKSAQ